MEDDFFLWPEGASSFAAQVDAVTFTYTAISSTISLLVIFFIIYFGIKYRRGSLADRTGGRPGRWLEWSWIGGMLAIVVPVYIWTAGLYITMFQPPPDAIEVYVIGKQWMWKTQHTNGRREINQLHVPVNRPVKLIMISQDVIHSFYVPEFRVKHDVLPGRYTTLWFEPTKVGVYNLFCTEYCGLEHSGMIGEVIVLDPADFQAWLSGAEIDAPGGQTGIGEQQARALDAPALAEDETGGDAALDAPALTGEVDTPASMVEAGALLFESANCMSCHRMDGGGIGPSLVGVYGSEIPLDSGQSVIADEEYLRESIVEPNARIVADYPSVMPSYAGQFTDEELMQLVEYIKSLGDTTTDDSATPEGSEPDDG